MKSSTLSQLISPTLIALNAEYCDREDFFRHSSHTLFRHNYVHADYLSHILARERESPTGLVAAGVNIAIPHTDPSHIKKPFIAITHLARSLPFCVMGTTDERIEVEWIFSLGVTRAENQIALLQALMAVFADEGQMKALRQLSTAEEIYQFFNAI